MNYLHTKPMNGLNLQLASYLSENRGWHSKGTLTADMEWRHQRGKHGGERYLPETVGRALRRLEEMKIIAVRNVGISVEYKWIPLDIRERYIPYSRRPDNAKEVLLKR